MNIGLKRTAKNGRRKVAVNLTSDNERRLACEHLINRFDTVMTEFESRWGMNVLPQIVSFDLAENWRLHMNDLNDAITRQDPIDLQDLVDGAARGLKAMEADAKARGHEPHEKEYWAVRLEDDRELRIYRTDLDANEPCAAGVIRYSLQEIARIVSNMG
jgi:hypothetical protein